MIRIRNFTLPAALMFILCLACTVFFFGVGPNAYRGGPKLRDFRWVDGTPGLHAAIAIPDGLLDFDGPSNIALAIEVSPELHAAWEVEEVSCFKLLGETKMRLGREGPWLNDSCPEAKSQRYSIVGLDSKANYEVTVRMRCRDSQVPRNSEAMTGLKISMDHAREHL